jgi:hypothetical protein
MDDKVNVSIHKTETPIKNREDLVVMALRAITDSARYTVEEQISQHINFITIALPEIPPDKYPRGKIFEMEPTMQEAKEKFFETVTILTPEFENAYIPNIIRLRKEMYLQRLRRERATVEDLLKTHTKWKFFHEQGSTLGR